MKTLLRALLRVLFRFRVYNESVLRTPGPVLLVPNHVSLLDWLLLGVCLEKDWRFVVSSVVAETNWLFRLVMKNRARSRSTPSRPMRRGTWPNTCNKAGGWCCLPRVG
jgi:1-acyl-sn-glycerol-3-phosphate acyltransferase